MSVISDIGLGWWIPPDSSAYYRSFSGKSKNVFDGNNNDGQAIYADF